jgi:hypothetical protein
MTKARVARARFTEAARFCSITWGPTKRRQSYPAALKAESGIRAFSLCVMAVKQDEVTGLSWSTRYPCMGQSSRNILVVSCNQICGKIDQAMSAGVDIWSSCRGRVLRVIHLITIGYMIGAKRPNPCSDDCIANYQYSYQRIQNEPL